MYVPGTTIDLSYLNDRPAAASTPAAPDTSRLVVPGTKFLFAKLFPSVMILQVQPVYA